MTNPPRGGSVSPPTTGSSTDFGATTLSGRTLAEKQRSAEQGDGHRLSEHEAAAGQTRVDTPLVTGTAAPPQAGTPGRSQAAAVPAADAAQGRPGGQPVRGIRTGRNRGPRRARLQIRHINPVTVLKFSCVLSVALFFVWLIVIGVLFGILDAAGVIGNINDTVTQLNGAGSKPPISAGIVFGGAAIIGVINIVLFIALSTMGAVIYNLCADLVGGVEITLSER